MHKLLILAVVLFVFTGFKWGDDADENGNADVKATEETSYEKPVDVKATEDAVKVPEVTKSAKAVDAAAAGPVGASPTLAGALATESPEALKQRIESLARVSRALKALNESKVAQ